MNPWEAEAHTAVNDYQKGIHRGEYPVKPEVGECQRTARCLYFYVTGHAMPWARDTAKNSMEAAIADGRAVVEANGHNAYHVAAAAGKIRPGAFLYFGDGKYGHVVSVIRVDGDPSGSLGNVTVMENTSRDDLGTHICPLSEVCAIHGGSDGITAVVT